jgi:hypothetical protein
VRYTRTRASSSARSALTQLNSELFSELVAGQKGVILPYRWVRAVGDVILINDVTLHDVIEQMTSPNGEEPDDSAIA